MKKIPYKFHVWHWYGRFKNEEKHFDCQKFDIVSVWIKDNAPENVSLDESYGVGHCVQRFNVSIYARELTSIKNMINRFDSIRERQFTKIHAIHFDIC